MTRALINLASFPGLQSIANTVEGLVQLLHRMMSGGRWEAWLIVLCISSTAVYRKCHASQHPPDFILRRSLLGLPLC